MSYKVNKLLQDDFGRVTGIVAINKPAGITSHDVVDNLRHALKTRQVGHAGALDPFATGVLILLVGKATKYSELFLNADKAYVAKVLFGISTDSADPEGEINQQTNILPELDVLKAQVADSFNKFMPEYTQFVPVFSSVKVGGDKLRVLARSADKFEIREENGQRLVDFHKGDKVHTIILPQHKCAISQLSVVDAANIEITDSEFYTKRQSELLHNTWPTVDVSVDCSKGTYVRILAEDIGQALPTPLPAMLWNLTRTRVGDINLIDCFELDKLDQLPITSV
jgi:tRNA pseudouridine55 synthase